MDSLVTYKDSKGDRVSIGSVDLIGKYSGPVSSRSAYV